MENKTENLKSFLGSSKTAYHAVANIKDILLKKGYSELFENEDWQLEDDKGYFVIRDGSSIIAFKNRCGAFMIGAAHSDSPAFRVKSSDTEGAYVKLSTERYGGMINYTWLDRPLTVAGRMIVREGGALKSALCDIGDKTVVIPSLAIHFDRSVNEGKKFDPKKDLLPLAALGEGDIISEAAASIGAKKDDVVSHELFLTSADEPRFAGLSDELLLSPRIDDLACVFACLEGFLSAKNSDTCPVLAVFDNEEVGSETKQGAASTFLYDTLRRISSSKTDYLKRVSESFMVSADNAHAIHPNYPEMSDRKNAPILGGGVVIKHNANQRYATDAVSEAIFREICSKAGVNVQNYFNRADLPGGSTLGSISDTKVSVSTVDIGIPQLAMHSAVETCAVKDVFDMVSALSVFFSSSLEKRGGEIKLNLG